MVIDVLVGAVLGLELAGGPEQGPEVKQLVLPDHGLVADLDVDGLDRVLLEQVVVEQPEVLGAHLDVGRLVVAVVLDRDDHDLHLEVGRVEPEQLGLGRRRRDALGQTRDVDRVVGLAQLEPELGAGYGLLGQHAEVEVRVEVARV